MSATGQIKSREFRRITIEKRGHEKEVRLPVFDKQLTGEKLRRTVGRMAMEQAGENRDKAVGIMEDWLMADLSLLNRMLDRSFFCRETIDNLIRATRSNVKSAGNVTMPTRSLVAGISQASRRNLMEYWLRPGLRLGDATRERLLEVASEDNLKATTMASNARWFRLIAKNLPDNKTQVRAALQESDLEQYLRRAQKDAA